MNKAAVVQFWIVKIRAQTTSVPLSEGPVSWKFIRLYIFRKVWLRNV